MTKTYNVFMAGRMIREEIGEAHLLRFLRKLEFEGGRQIEIDPASDHGGLWLTGFGNRVRVETIFN